MYDFFIQKRYWLMNGHRYGRSTPGQQLETDPRPVRYPDGHSPYFY